MLSKKTKAKENERSDKQLKAYENRLEDTPRQQKAEGGTVPQEPERQAPASLSSRSTNRKLLRRELKGTERDRSFPSHLAEQTAEEVGN